jgi:hypothetical protein
MIKVFSFVVLLIITLSGCKKEEPGFISGELSIGIRSNADLVTVFNKFNELNFEIKTMHGFHYSVNLPNDSLSSIIDYLNTKSYVNTGNGWTATAYYNTSEENIRVVSSLFDMNENNQIDFIATISFLNLEDLLSDTKYMYIKISVGTEKYWFNELKKYPFIKWTELSREGGFLIE